MLSKATVKKLSRKSADILGIFYWHDDLSLLTIYFLLSKMLNGDEDVMMQWFQNPQGCFEGRIPARLIINEQGTNLILMHLREANQ